MENLDIALDLLWEGKIEPLSPSQLALANIEDIQYFENDFAIDELLNTKLKYNTKINKNQQAFLLEIQQDMLRAVEDTEQWLNQPMSISLLNEYPAPIEPTRAQPVKIENTAQLLKEFDTVLNGITQLTPPQSPPQHQYNNDYEQNYCYSQNNTINQIPISATATSSSQINNYQQIPFTAVQPHQQPQQQQLQQQQLQQQQLIPIFYDENIHGNNQMYLPPQNVLNPITIEPSINEQSEMDVVDELVRTRSQDLPDLTIEDDCDLSSESVSIASLSPRSESSYVGSNCSNDDVYWLSLNKGNSDNIDDGENGINIKKRRPYKRTPVEKKYRKKEQNKNAATRYRKKKKAEIEIILDEEQKLRLKNDQLQSKCNDVGREIKYLKSLMRDLYRAKGVL